MSREPDQPPAVAWPLDDPAAAWLVSEGTVNVFAFYQPDGAPGRRVLVRSFGPGDVFGVSPDTSAELSLLAVASPDSDVTLAPDARASLIRPHEVREAVETVLAGETAQLSARRARDDQLLAQARSRLTRLLDERPAPAANAEHPLAAAVSVIAQHYGTAARVPDDWRESGDLATDVQAVAQWAGLRARRVELAADWTRTLSEPVLVVARDSGPLAVLPSRGRTGRWKSFEPVSGVLSSFDPRTAAVQPGAFVFVRTLDSGIARFRHLAGLMYPGIRRDLAWMAVLALLAGVMALLAPVILGRIVSVVLPQHQPGVLFVMVVMLVAAAISLGIFELTRNYTLLRVTGRFDKSALPALWDRTLRLPASFFREHEASDIASRIVGVDSARVVIGEALVVSGLSAAFAFVNLVLLTLVLPSVGVVTVCVLAAFALAVAAVLRSILRLERRKSAKESRLDEFSLQLITGISKIRVAGAQTRAFDRWSQGFSSVISERTHIGARTGTIGVAALTLPLVASTVIYAWIVATGQSDISVSAFVVFAVAVAQATGALAALAVAASAVMAAVPQIERARPILEFPAESHGSGRQVELTGAIDVSAVRFSYAEDMPEVLKGVTLSIPAGSFTAIVGPSGSGKSTLLRLILGFESPSAGSVFFDSHDLAELDVQRVRQQLGVVLQDFRVVAGSILDNIVGSRRLGTDDAWEAVRKVGLEDFIRSLPMGMQTFLVDGGGTLSGGQLQRLMLARAVAGQPKILLLDEATSALDNRTQALVSESLSRLHTTRVVIAHRLSTVKDADQIVCLVDGKIAEQGDYGSLMALDGVFADLARRQLT